MSNHRVQALLVLTLIAAFDVSAATKRPVAAAEVADAVAADIFVPELVSAADCSVNSDVSFCNGFDAPPTIMPGTEAAELGAPSLVKFNGLGLISDTLHHLPLHAVPTAWSAPPAPTRPASIVACTTPCLRPKNLLRMRAGTRRAIHGFHAADAAMPAPQ